MDTERMEEIYQEIGQQLNIIIPEDWDRVILYSAVSEFSNRTYFYYFPTKRNTPIFSLDIEDKENVVEEEINEQLHELYNYLRDLWNEFENQNQEKWTNLTLELLSTGKLNIDYRYNDIQNEDSYEQQVIWEYEKLNIKPNHRNQRDIKIIEEYIKRSKNSESEK
ncbi:conserved hypothetical protein [Terribacillus aidingensis]|uniref:TIGR01741 family protein n=1 Tax=Terribacillus aidingensis TaxID=586416 RepID=A0A285N0Z4_9BACI|nr:immunity protein YezG family protein [Terribacillus aidingensis]SNZ03134.1 conserved hypothetical protein [Terribacillus aidingensis]